MAIILRTAYFFNPFCIKQVPINCSKVNPKEQAYFVTESNVFPDGCGGFLPIGTKVNYEDTIGKISYIWRERTPIVSNIWNSVVYGNGLFVAVSGSGTGNRVMTSPDGITWTSRTSAADNFWTSVVYGGGLFVAVSSSGTGNRVMTSPDGITWTSRTSAADNSWESVTYGGGLFVAVSYTGTGNRVMTSPDGITWTSRTSAADLQWLSVTYGNGLFVAVSGSGTGNRVMTSPDGITWTSRTSAADNTWYSVTYGGGLFVAVSCSGTNQAMTSPDGINWTSQSIPRGTGLQHCWKSVTYGDGIFIAVDKVGNGLYRVATSPDGVTWTLRTTPEYKDWNSVAYGNGVFVAVSGTDYGDSAVMTSGENPWALLLHVAGGGEDYWITGTAAEFRTDCECVPECNCVLTFEDIEGLPEEGATTTTYIVRTGAEAGVYIWSGSAYVLIASLALGYKIYRALLNQTGSNAPVATVLENNLGGVPTFTRSAPGQYSCIGTGLFTVNKTIVRIGSNGGSSGLTVFSSYDLSLNDFYFYTGTGSFIPNAGGLANTPLEIIVYN